MSDQKSFKFSKTVKLAKRPKSNRTPTRPKNAYSNIVKRDTKSARQLTPTRPTLPKILNKHLLLQTLNELQKDTAARLCRQEEENLHKRKCQMIQEQLDTILSRVETHVAKFSLGQELAVLDLNSDDENFEQETCLEKENRIKIKLENKISNQKTKTNEMVDELFSNSSNIINTIYDIMDNSGTKIISKDLEFKDFYNEFNTNLDNNRSILRRKLTADNNLTNFQKEIKAISAEIMTLFKKIEKLAKSGNFITKKNKGKNEYPGDASEENLKFWKNFENNNDEKEFTSQNLDKLIDASAVLMQTNGQKFFKFKNKITKIYPFIKEEILNLKKSLYKSEMQSQNFEYKVQQKSKQITNLEKIIQENRDYFDLSQGKLEHNRIEIEQYKAEILAILDKVEDLENDNQKLKIDAFEEAKKSLIEEQIFIKHQDIINLNLEQETLLDSIEVAKRTISEFNDKLSITKDEYDENYRRLLDLQADIIEKQQTELELGTVIEEMKSNLADIEDRIMNSLSREDFTEDDIIIIKESIKSLTSMKLSSTDRRISVQSFFEKELNKKLSIINLNENVPKTKIINKGETLTKGLHFNDVDFSSNKSTKFNSTGATTILNRKVIDDVYHKVNTKSQDVSSDEILLFQDKISKLEYQNEQLENYFDIYFKTFNMFKQKLVKFNQYIMIKSPKPKENIPKLISPNYEKQTIINQSKQILVLLENLDYKIKYQKAKVNNCDRILKQNSIKIEAEKARQKMHHQKDLLKLKIEQNKRSKDLEKKVAQFQNIIDHLEIELDQKHEDENLGELMSKNKKLEKDLEIVTNVYKSVEQKLSNSHDKSTMLTNNLNKLKNENTRLKYQILALLDKENEPKINKESTESFRFNENLDMPGVDQFLNRPATASLMKLNRNKTFVPNLPQLSVSSKQVSNLNLENLTKPIVMNKISNFKNEQIKHEFILSYDDFDTKGVKDIKPPKFKTEYLPKMKNVINENKNNVSEISTNGLVDRCSEIVCPQVLSLDINRVFNSSCRRLKSAHCD